MLGSSVPSDKRHASLQVVLRQSVSILWIVTFSQPSHIQRSLSCDLYMFPRVNGDCRSQFLDETTKLFFFMWMGWRPDPIITLYIAFCIPFLEFTRWPPHPSCTDGCHRSVQLPDNQRKSRVHASHLQTGCAHSKKPIIFPLSFQVQDSWNRDPWLGTIDCHIWAKHTLSPGWNRASY